MRVSKGGLIEFSIKNQEVSNVCEKSYIELCILALSRFLNSLCVNAMLSEARLLSNEPSS